MCSGRHGYFWETLKIAWHDATSALPPTNFALSEPRLTGQRQRAGAPDMIDIRTTSLGISFAVRVHPRAKKNAITGEVGGAIKLAISAPPVDGKANQACIDFFAKLLKVPRSSITIATGETSRNKTLCVSGVSADYLRERLA